MAKTYPRPKVALYFRPSRFVSTQYKGAGRETSDERQDGMVAEQIARMDSHSYAFPDGGHPRSRRPVPCWPLDITGASISMASFLRVLGILGMNMPFLVITYPVAMVLLGLLGAKLLPHSALLGRIG
jgi:hypothetical protein